MRSALQVKRAMNPTLFVDMIADLRKEQAQNEDLFVNLVAQKQAENRQRKSRQNLYPDNLIYMRRQTSKPLEDPQNVWDDRPPISGRTWAVMAFCAALLIVGLVMAGQAVL